jgi:hypothetical protein
MTLAVACARINSIELLYVMMSNAQQAESIILRK